MRSTGSKRLTPRPALAPPLLLLLVCLLAACQGIAAGKPGFAPRDEGDLIVLLEKRKEHAVLYEVEKSARIHFAGGEDAMVGNFSWEGAMSDADFTDLQEVLERHDWFAEEPESAGAPKTHYYRVTVYRPSGQLRRFEVTGPCPALDEVLAICDRSARQRFKPILDQLPEAGPQDG